MIEAISLLEELEEDALYDTADLSSTSSSPAGSTISSPRRLGNHLDLVYDTLLSAGSLPTTRRELQTLTGLSTAELDTATQSWIQLRVAAYHPDEDSFSLLTLPTS